MERLGPSHQSRRHNVQVPEPAQSPWSRLKDQSRFLHGKGFFHLLTGNFLGQFLSVAMIFVVAKLVTKEELGSLRVLQSYLMVLIPVSAFGANVTLLKFCSENRPEEEKQAIFSYGIRRLAFTALAAALIFCGVVKAGYLTPSAQIAGWAVVLVWTVPLQNLMDACSWYLQSQRKLVETAKLIAAVRGQNFVLAVLATWIFGMPGFLYGLLFGFLAALVPIVKAVGPTTFAVRPIRPPKFDRLSFQAWVSSSLSVAMVYADSYLLDHYIKDRSQIPDYQMGAIFSLAAMQITATAQNIAAPFYSERSHDDAWMRHKMLHFQGKLFASSLAIAVALLGVTWLVIHFIYPNYTGAVGYTAILLLRYVVLAGSGILSMGLLGKGRHEWNALGSLAGMIVGVTVGLTLLPRMGASGIAWGQVASAGAMSLVVWTGMWVVFGRRGEADSTTWGDGARK